MKLQSELDGALEASSQGYRTANDNFAKASRTIDAVDEGAAATSGRLRSEDNLARALRWYDAGTTGGVPGGIC